MAVTKAALVATEPPAGRPVESVSVVIVTYNSAAVLGGCLRSLDAGLEGLRVAEVLVVDNASRDETLAVAAAERPEAMIIATGRNGGYAAGVNAGLARSTGDAVLILNPDVRLLPGSVAEMVTLLDGACGIAVPRMVGPGGGLYPSLRREPSLRTAYAEALLGGRRAARAGLTEMVAEEERYAQVGEADWATGAAMLVSRACLEAVGPWDESFLLYSEETDFCLRARDAGFALRFSPHAVVQHLGGESRTSPMLWSLLTVNRVRLYRRRHRLPAAAAFAAAVSLGELMRAVAGRRTSQAALAALLRPSQRMRHLPQ